MSERVSWPVSVLITAGGWEVGSGVGGGEGGEVEGWIRERSQARS